MKTKELIPSKIMVNCQVTKRKEYSQSYGGVEVVDVPFIREYPTEIDILNATGETVRRMRKYTKLLIGFSGTEISERAFLIRCNKAAKERAAKIAERKAAEDAAKDAYIQSLAPVKKFLNENSELVLKLIAKEKQNRNGIRTAMWKLTGRTACSFTINQLMDAYCM